MTMCPFCGGDPFHRVDNGCGMEAVAVTCCENGDEYFRGARPEPETVTMSWDDFQSIGNKLAQMRREAEERDAESLSPIALAGDREAVERRHYTADDPEVEPVAQAIWESLDGDKTPWRHLFEPEQREYRSMAIAALNAAPPAQPAEERAVWWTDDEIVLAHLEGLFNLINQGDVSPAIMQAQVASIRAALSRARTGSEAQIVSGSPDDDDDDGNQRFGHEE